VSVKEGHVIGSTSCLAFNSTYCSTAYFFEPPHEENEKNPEDHDDDPVVDAKNGWKRYFPQRTPCEKVVFDQGVDFRIDSSSSRPSTDNYRVINP
jgi:hypothetical protein